MWNDANLLRTTFGARQHCRTKPALNAFAITFEGRINPPTADHESAQIRRCLSPPKKARMS
jgi:hypothetical protein